MYLSRRGIGMQWRMIRNNDLLDLYLYNLNSSCIVRHFAGLKKYPPIPRKCGE